MLKDYQHSINDANQYLKLESNNDVILRLTLRKAYCYEQLGKYQQALQTFNDIIESPKSLEMSEEFLEKVQLFYQSIISYYHIPQNVQEKQENEDEEEQEDEDDVPLLMHEGLQIVYTEEKGRFMIASQDIESEQILLSEKPYMSMVFTLYFMDHCNHCTRLVTNSFVPCYNCTEAVFCNEKCRSQGWIKFHKYECGLYSFMSNLGANAVITFRILMQFGIAKALKFHKDGFDKRSQSTLMRNYEMFCQLLQHREDHKVSAYAMSTAKSINIIFVLDYLGLIDRNNQQMINELFAICVGHQLRCMINTFGMFKNDPKTNERIHIGNSVVLISSFINHSCSPNVWWKHKQNRMKMTTIRFIKKGEEVNITYGPFKSQSFQIRQHRLQYSYYFTCHCQFCMKEANKLTALKCLNCSGPIVYGYEQFTEEHAYCFYCSSYYQNVDKAIKIVEQHKNLIDNLIYHFEAAKVTTEYPMKIAQRCIEVFNELLYPKCDQLFQLRVKVNRFFTRWQTYNEKVNHCKDMMTFYQSHVNEKYKQLLILAVIYYKYLLKKPEFDPVQWSLCSQIVYEMSKYMNGQMPSHDASHGTINDQNQVEHYKYNYKKLFEQLSDIIQNHFDLSQLASQ